MNSKRSLIAIFSILFVVLALFQNCGSSDFNADEYTNQSSAASTAVLAPTIISKSSDLSINLGESALFSVAVDGSQPLQYVWYKDNQVIAGADESSYLVNSAQTLNAGTYAVVISNSAGSVTTTYQLTVMSSPPPAPPATTAPVITSPPAPFVYILRTQAIRLQVVATGTNLTYQWYFKSLGAAAATPISGATSSLYTRLNASPLHSGTYTVVVSNAGGSTSASSEVEVDPEAPFRTGIDTR